MEWIKQLFSQKKIGLISKKEITILDVIGHEIIEKRLLEIDGYGYKSLVFCVVDSVYSLAAKYASTKKVVERLAKYLNIKISEQYLVSQFNEKFNNMNPEELANNVFQNRQRTSTKNGILKSEAVVSFLQVLQEFGIETKEDFIKHKNDEILLDRIKKIKGQTYGTTFNYALMLAGDTGTFKQDRHIINFFQKYFGVKDISYTNLNFEFDKQLQLIRIRYPNYNTRTLDAAIWHFMSDNK